MRLDSFAKNTVIMLAASSLGSFFNLLYQLTMLRMLPKDEFSSLNSLIALLAIITVPAAAFTTVVTKHISAHNARKQLEHLSVIWRKTAADTLCFGLAVFSIIIFLRKNIASFLHLDSLGSITILGLIFFFVCLSSVVTGGLQGLERFKWLAAVGLAAGLSKLLFSVALIKSINDKLLAGLTGFLLSAAIGVILCLWPLRFLLNGKSKEKIETKQLYAYIFPVLAVSLCFTLVTNIDLVLVKHFFLTEAQDYSIAQMIGKIILFLPGVIYAIMFSRVSGLHALKTNSREILKRSLLYTFALSFSAVAVYNLFPEVTFGLLAGQATKEIVLLGRFFSLAMLFYALSNVLFVYQLSVERYDFIRPLVIIALAQIIAICLFHATTIWVLGIMLAGSVLMFGLNLRSALYQKA